tara:strand:+ start:111 stop:701 length:591 start_codon:yes stop_codon:yes gene_type:complete
MPVFDENILFLHIPRSGGSIIENKLKETYTMKFYGSDTSGLSLQHYTANELIKKNVDIDKMFSFTFVRNPFDKILSTYLNWSIDHTKSFDDYIDMVKNVVENKLYYKISAINTNDLSHFKPQVELLENLKSDFVGKFENYENDIKILSKMHPKLTCLNEINIKKREVDYKQHYSERNRNIIEELYKNDLIKFKYTF